MNAHCACVVLLFIWMFWRYFFFFVYSTPHLGNECERNIQLVLSAEWIKFTMQVAAHFGAADHSFCVSMTMQLSFAVMSPYSPLPLTTSIQSVIFCRRIYAYYSCRSIEMERRNLNRQILCSVNAEEFPFRWETLSSIHFFFFCRTSFRMTNTYWCGVLHPTTARDRSIEQQTASEQIIIALGKYEICSNEAACDRRWINCIHFGGRSFGPHTAASLVFSFTRLNALNIDRGHGIWHGPGVDVGGSRQGQMPRSNALIHCSWYSYFCVCVAGCVFENMKIWITVLEKFEKYSDALLSNVAVATTVLANRPNQKPVEFYIQYNSMQPGSSKPRRIWRVAQLTWHSRNTDWPYATKNAPRTARPIKMFVYVLDFIDLNFSFSFFSASILFNSIEQVICTAMQFVFIFSFLLFACMHTLA